MNTSFEDPSAHLRTAETIREATRVDPHFGGYVSKVGSAHQRTTTTTATMSKPLT